MGFSTRSVTPSDLDPAVNVSLRTYELNGMRQFPQGAVLTSQLYFPDDVSDEVLALPPYAARGGRDTTNDTDEILPTGGDPAVLEISPVGVGYRAAICLVVSASAGPRERT